jgi:hypothetical protein
MPFAVITLELLTPLHLGAGRSGRLARCHRFVPGHLLTYSLATAIGKANGGQQVDFKQALTQVCQQVRCGPLFIWDAEHEEVLLPYQHQQRIEMHYLTTTNHITVSPESRAVLAGALFEVEALAAQQLRGKKRGVPTRLIGGIWYETDKIASRPLSVWLNHCILGGELKTGLGRVKCVEWQGGANAYPGIQGRCDAKGLSMKVGSLLPGPALEGVINAPLRPWVGRLYDVDQGFGRRLSSPVLVRVEGKVKQEACFLPANTEKGFGCWSIIETN